MAVAPVTPVQVSNLNADGTKLGQSAADLISFYGTVPVSQRTSAVQASSNISLSTFATIGSNTAAALSEIFQTLQGLGLWKGS